MECEYYYNSITHKHYHHCITVTLNNVFKNMTYSYLAIMKILSKASRRNLLNDDQTLECLG
jgi:hypothetical protein